MFSHTTETKKEEEKISTEDKAREADETECIITLRSKGRKTKEVRQWHYDSVKDMTW